MPNDEELKKIQERKQRELLEAQRKQIEESRRINEQRQREADRRKQANKGGPISERPTKDEDE